MITNRQLIFPYAVPYLALQWDQARKRGDREALQTALDGQSINDVKAGEWPWPAAIAFGLLMSFLWAYRKDLLSCIVAHAVTNITLACYVLLTGNW